MFLRWQRPSRVAEGERAADGLRMDTAAAETARRPTITTGAVVFRRPRPPPPPVREPRGEALRAAVRPRRLRAGAAAKQHASARRATTASPESTRGEESRDALTRSPSRRRRRRSFVPALEKTLDVVDGDRWNSHVLEALEILDEQRHHGMCRRLPVHITCCCHRVGETRAALEMRRGLHNSDATPRLPHLTHSDRRSSICAEVLIGI